MLTLFVQSNNPAQSQCYKTKVTPLDIISIEGEPGNTAGDPTFDIGRQFIDLDISSVQNLIGVCALKSKSVKALNVDPSTGALMIVNGVGETDFVMPGDPSATRGICAINYDGSEIFTLGNGPIDQGFDRIYSYGLNPSSISRIQSAGGYDSYTPSDLSTSLAVTPNNKFLVYLQGNSSNKSLASIQSILIKEDKSLSSSFIGQDISQVISPGTFLRFAKGQDNTSKIVYGIFSDIQQGVGGSGAGFVLFKTDQTTGSNSILGEYKKGDSMSPLPSVFNSPDFVGFSGFDFIEKDNDLYLFISYVSKGGGKGFTTNIAVLKTILGNEKSRDSSFSLVGSPISTVFKTLPCESNEQGLSGPIWVDGNNIYLADNNTGSNYFAIYSIDWDTNTIALSSLPISTSSDKNEANTDIIGIQDKYAYVAVANLSNVSGKIYRYSFEQNPISCSSLKSSLGLCSSSDSVKPSGSKGDFNDESDADSDISSAPPAPVQPVPAQPALAPAPIAPTAVAVSPFAGSSTNSVFSPSSYQSSSVSSSNSGRPSAPSSYGSNSYQAKYQPKPPSLPPSIQNNLSLMSMLDSNPTEPALPPIELKDLQDSIVKAVKSASQGVDVMALNLKGADQQIITPTISNIIFNQKIETPKIEIIKDDNDLIAKSILAMVDPKVMAVIPESPSLVLETKGIIRAGSVAVSIGLKPGVILQTKNVRDLIHVLIDKNQKGTIIPSTNVTLNVNSVLSVLSLPDDLKAGDYTLALVLNRGGGKKDVVAKGSVKLFDSYNFQNTGDQELKGLPQVNKINGKLVGKSAKRGSLIRLTLYGDNFASRSVQITNKSFLSAKSKTLTTVSFTDDKNFEIVRTRVLNKGRKMLMIVRYFGDGDLTNKSLTISTPKGHFYLDKLGIKLFTNKPDRSITLTPDENKPLNNTEKPKKE